MFGHSLTPSLIALGSWADEMDSLPNARELKACIDHASRINYMWWQHELMKSMQEIGLGERKII